MKVQIIKQEISPEISEAGGASVMLVNKETVDLETTIDEAKDGLFVMGNVLLIKGLFVGLFKSMVNGIERDGNARQLGDFLTLYPVPTGEFDLDKGWDPEVNGVRIRARLMNEMEIDISKWEFEDVTPGRQSFTIESVQAGATTGVVELGQAVAINGRNLPLTADVRVEYAVPELDLSGTVAAAKVTSSATRIDLTADALDALKVAGVNGKQIVLTVRGNFANAKITGVLKYVPVRATAKFTDSSGTEIYTEIYPERQALFFTCATHEFVNGEPITLKKYNNAGTLLETVEKTLVVDGMGTAASCTNPFTAGAGNGKVTVENTAVFGEIAWLDAEP